MYEKIDKKYVLNTYKRNYTNFTHGKNATLFSDSGKNYIDFTSGIGVVSVGHGNKKVAKCIYNQAKKITHLSNLYEIAPQALLAQKLSKLSGFDLGVFFANSGAEANEGAIKLARKYGTKSDLKRYKIITLKNSFHGRTIATIKATGQSDFQKIDFAPYPKGFSFADSLDDVEKMIDNKTVAVMIELIQGEGGVMPLDKKKVQKLATLLKQKDILLIVDEVQSGVYRTGEFLASQVYGIKPDIITLAKGLGGGVPIGAVLSTHKDIFTLGDHGSTFGGTFLVTQTSLKVLEILQKYKKSKKLDANIVYFNKKLDKLIKTFPNLFSHKAGVGLMQGIRCKIDVAKLVNVAHSEHVLVLKAGQNTLRFLPPLTISKNEIKLGFQRLHKAYSSLNDTI